MHSYCQRYYSSKCKLNTVGWAGTFDTKMQIKMYQLSINTSVPRMPREEQIEIELGK